ncbi:MAG: matrixin family metalloprotease [Nanoarchaeota archaeon]
MKIKRLDLVIGLILFFGILIFSNLNKLDNLTDNFIQEGENPYHFNYYFENELDYSNFSKYNQEVINGGDYKKQQIIKAFKVITNDTNGYFKFDQINNSKDADFIINYYPYDEDVVYSGNERTDTKGESYVLGKEYYPYSKNYPDIINFYSPGNSCGGYPQQEMHEILHGLGLEHSENENSIMYPYFICTTLEKDNESLIKLYQVWD